MYISQKVFKYAKTFSKYADKFTYKSTYKVTEVFPMGALPRKSLAMGLIHITRIISGDRKLMCKRILKGKTNCCDISNQTLHKCNIVISVYV